MVAEGECTLGLDDGDPGTLYETLPVICYGSDVRFANLT